MAKRSMDTDGPSGGRIRKPNVNAAPPVDFAYTNLNLTDADKSAIEGMPIDEARFIDWLSARAAEGYKLSVRYESKSGGYLVSMTAGEASMPDYNTCLTARRSDVWGAWCTLVYKFDVLLEGGPLPRPTEMPKRPVWD